MCAYLWFSYIISDNSRPGVRPDQVPLPRRSHAHPMPPAGALWVVCPRPPGTAGLPSDRGRHTRRVVEARRVSHSPVSPAQLRPERPPVSWTCGHHADAGSPVILLSPPTGVRLVVLPHLQPGTGRAPAGLAWGTCNRIVPGGSIRRRSAVVSQSREATWAVPCSV